MVSRIAQWTLDVHDVDAMAAFWSAALGYRVDRNRDGVVHLLPPEGASPDTLTIWLQPTVEPKTNKNVPIRTWW
jgi:catechol-2,3-dioxygenase